MAREAHPALPVFDYVKPNSLAEAIRVLVKQRGAGLLILGGTRNLSVKHWQWKLYWQTVN